ncbi:hypothetical protein ABW19_dt0209551 [Dactylella cylindrospora]|nr:hypothetical protein ABW19_dt0209551 [Dactylella cylindrospora]
MAFWKVIGALAAAYFVSFIYRLARNWRHARRLGFPVVFLPLVQNNPLWMVLGVPLRPLLRHYLPRSLFVRLSITIHGWENQLKLEPYMLFSTPYGSPKSFTLAGAGRVELSTWDREIASEILRRPKDFMQFEDANFLLSRFGDNVLSTDGEVWARHRKIVASVINERISKVVFNEATNLTKGLVQEIFEETPNSGSAETDHMFDMVKKLTIIVLANAGMGGSQPWKDPATKQVKPGFKLTYIEAVKAVVGQLIAAAVFPRWFLASYPSFLPGYDTMRLLSYAVGEFREHTSDLMNEEKRRNSTPGGETRSNILSMLLRASEEGKKESLGGESRGKSAISLSDSEIMGNLFIFTAAGFDTTSNTIAFALVELVRNPQYQEWLFEEIDNLLPEDPNEEFDYATTFPRVQRCLATLHETLRLYPPIIHLGKQTKAPQVIKTSKDTVELPAGTTIFINSVVVHLDPDIWRGLNWSPLDKTVYENGEAVEDEFTFRPTRWINAEASGTENAQSKMFQPPRGAFVPWSMGPRVCPGQKMAQVEFTAILLTLLRYHRLEAVKIKVSDSNGGVRDETDEELKARISMLIKGSISKVTLEMDVYDITEKDIKVGERRGLGLRLVHRK